MQKQSLKSQVRAGGTSIGTWVYIAHPDVSEMLALQGLDWLLFDMEHGPITIETLQRLMQPMNGSPTAAIVRVPWEQPGLVGQVLDCGAEGIVFPMINDRAQAEAAVAACRYPPHGKRGMGPRRCTAYGRDQDEYLESGHQQLLIAVQIETTEAVAQIGQILSVEGVDAALIGPGDLSADMGCHLEFDHSEFVRALQTVLDACQRHNVIPGIAYAADADAAARYLSQGFRFIGVGTDDDFLIRGVRSVVATLKERK